WALERARRLSARAALDRLTAQHTRGHQDRAGLRRQLEDDGGLRGERGAVGLDENAARRDIDHANLGAVLEPGTTQPRRVLGAETHLSAPVLRTRGGV